MHIIHFSFECGGFDHRLMRGGLSPLVWNLSREYAARGHRVSLVTPAHGLLDALRRDHPVEELPYAHEHRVPLVLDPKVWPGRPAEVTLELTTRAHRLRLDGVDVYFLSDAFLDLLPDRLYPPPGTEGRDLAYFKPLVFQVAGAHFIQRYLRGEEAVVHGFEPYYHYLLPPLFAGDPSLRTVSTVAANAPVTQKVYRPQVERLLGMFGVSADLDAAEEPLPAEDGPEATMARVLAGTRMHVEYGPDHIAFLPLVLAHADLVDFVSPGQRDHYSTFRDTPVESLFHTLPVSRMLREQAHKLLVGGCGISDSWLARDPGAVDRAAVLRSLGLDPALPVFYHAARYAVHHKGQVELVRAVDEVLTDGLEAVFVLRFATSGGGQAAPAGNAYFQSVAARHPGRIHLEWRLADEDTLFEQAACADFCVFPSKFELDGFLIAQAEAMACGAVPIATAQSVTAHFGHALPADDPRATGFALPGSFRDDDPDLTRALADRIRQAAALRRAAPDEHARLSANSRFRAREFTWARSADRRLAAFTDVLRGRPRTFPAEDAIRYGWFDALPPPPGSGTGSPSRGPPRPWATRRPTVAAHRWTTRPTSVSSRPPTRGPTSPGAPRLRGRPGGRTGPHGCAAGAGRVRTRRAACTSSTGTRGRGTWRWRCPVPVAARRTWSPPRRRSPRTRPCPRAAVSSWRPWHRRARASSRACWRGRPSGGVCSSC